MGRTKDAMIECWEAGAVPVEMPQVREWRVAGHDVPVTWITVEGFAGPVALPAIALPVAERLAAGLKAEDAREGLRQALDDARGYLAIAGCEITQWIRGRAASCRATADRLAGEIIAAVTAGEELPEEWFERDTYADIGEPMSEEICRLVREALEGTGIRV